MKRPEAYRVRECDMRDLLRKLNRPSASLADVFDAARTLVGFAEPIYEEGATVTREAIKAALDDPNVWEGVYDSEKGYCLAESQIPALLTALGVLG